MTAEKSVTVTYKNKKILVSELPEEIRNEIATWDRMSQDRLDIFYELEKLELAWQAKKAQIGNMIEQIENQSQNQNHADSEESEPSLDS